MPVTGSIIIDGSRWEPKIAMKLAKELGVVSAIFCVNLSGSYDLNDPNNQGGVATYVDPALEGHVIAAQEANMPIELYYNLNYSGDLEGGYSKTHYMHDALVAMTKNIPFKALWCSMEYWYIWRGNVQSKMTPQNMRAALDLERSMARVKWPTRPWGMYSSRNYIHEADLDPNSRNADGTMKDSQQIYTWLNNQLTAKTMRWWAAYYPTLSVDYTKHYTPAQMLAMLTEPSTDTKRARLFIGDNGPDVWQFSDHLLADFVMENDGSFTAGDWDVTSLTREQYWASINWEEPNPTQTCPAGQHWDGTQCVPDSIPEPPPSGDVLQAISELKAIVQGVDQKVTTTQQAVQHVSDRQDGIFK